MKKVLSIIMAVALLCTVIITANAGTPNPGTVTISGPDSIAIGSTADYTISIADCPDATSYSIQVSLGDKFTIFKGQWTDTELSMKNFAKASGQGACTVGLTTNEETGDDELVAKDINGTVFKLTVKATAATTEAQNLTVTITAKNGSTEVFNVTSTKSLTAACAVHTFGDWSQKSAATCTKPEVEHRVCSVCGYEETKEVGSVLEHSFGEWTETTPATCTTAGVETRTCTRECGEEGATQTRPIAAKGHTFSEWIEKTPATCETAGLEYRYCTKICEEDGAYEERPIAALGHDWGEWVVVKEVTDTEMGLEQRVCKNNSEHTETRDIPITYKVTEGDNADYKAADKQDFVVASSADPAKFVSLKIDGNIVDPSNYTIDPDYTKITIKAEYMATLAAGSHDVTIVSTDGAANTTVAVEAIPAPATNEETESDNTSPKTGANSMVELWIMLSILAAGAYVTSYLVKKSKAN